MQGWGVQRPDPGLCWHHCWVPEIDALLGKWPYATVCVYVDDISVEVTGGPAFVSRALVEVFNFLIARLTRGARLVVNQGKTRILTSSSEVRKGLIDRLEGGRGLTALAAPFLGVDRTLRPRRTVVKQKARLGSLARRCRRVATLRKAGGL
eukprot:2842108-Lingulodinium_polyedra.AAC.1